MKIEEISIEKIIPYEFNNKIHGERQVNMIANSIKEFGFTQPLVIDQNNVVIIGHGRLLAAIKLGIEKVPVIKMENLTETQIKKLRILDNKLNESPRDDKNLRLELEELDFDLSIGDIELKSEELFPLKIERVPFVNQEIDIEDLGEFECKCPKCGFEFNLDK